MDILILWLIVTTILWVVAFIPALMISGLSVMAFDAPDSTKMWQPYVLVAFVWLCPLLIIIAIVGSWIAYAADHDTLARIISLLPVPHLLLYGWFVLLPNWRD